MIAKFDKAKTASIKLQSNLDTVKHGGGKTALPLHQYRVHQAAAGNDNAANDEAATVKMNRS